MPNFKATSPRSAWPVSVPLRRDGRRQTPRCRRRTARAACGSTRVPATRSTPRPSLPGRSGSATSRSSAPATPASGPRTTSVAPIRRCASRCSRREIAGFGASGRNGGWCSALLRRRAEPARERARTGCRDRACSGRCSTPSTRSARSAPTRASTATSPRAARPLRHGAGPPRSPAGAGSTTARASASPTTTMRWLDAAEARDRIDVDGAARRGATRRTARRSTRPGSRAASPTWSSATASRSTSRPRCASIDAGRVAHRARHGPGRRRRPRDRGLHRDAPRAAPGARADLLADDRDRAAPGVGLGRDRLDRPRDDHRRPPPDHLRPAHRRRPHRVRRAAARPTTSARRSDADFDRDRATCSSTSAACSRELVPATQRRAHHPRVGRTARRAARLAPRRSASTAPPGWRGPAATSATAWRPRTSPAARSPTSSPAPTPRSSHLPWVQHRSPDWEPEPLRWLGHRALDRARAQRRHASNAARAGPRSGSPCSRRSSGLSERRASERPQPA